MKRFPGREDDAREDAEPRRGENPCRKLKIESLREKAPGTVEVTAGGSSFIAVPEQLESLGLPASALMAGAELDEAASALLALAAEAHEAERRGSALLARAEQSTFMLRIKLEQRGFSARATSLALERLAAGGWLDDGRFARAYASSRLARRPEGPASLAAALRARGVDPETTATAIREILEPGARKDALARAYDREFKRNRGDREHTRSALCRLGFTATEISTLLEERET
jgi:SOS response regulatory protein OraA/RecX